MLCQNFQGMSYHISKCTRHSVLDNYLFQKALGCRSSYTKEEDAHKTIVVLQTPGNVPS